MAQEANNELESLQVVSESRDQESSIGEPTKKKRKRKRKRKSLAEGQESENVDVAAAATKEPVFIDEEYQSKVDQVDRTVYVEGIPFHVSEQDVRKFFGNTGIVDCRLPVWQDSGRLRGYGHIVLDSAESYQAALEKSGQYLQKRYLTVEPAKRPKDMPTAPPPQSEPSKTVALHNLSYTAMEEDIEDVMETFGLIAEGGVRVVRHSATGQSKGFAYVQYEDLDSAKAAVGATPIVILGRPCRLDYDHGRVKGSFRTADRKLWQKEYGK